MKNAIVVCATNNWLAPAAVTLLSCSQHGASEYADLLIVTPNPSHEHEQQLQKFNAKHETTIKLVTISAAIILIQVNNLLFFISSICMILFILKGIFLIPAFEYLLNFRCVALLYGITFFSI